MVAVSLHPLAEEDIKGVLAFTLETFGRFQAIRYRAMLEAAFDRLAERPSRGKHRPHIHPQAWVYRIATPGHRASHLLLYRFLGGQSELQIIRVLHVAMNLPKHWPKEL